MYTTCTRHGKIHEMGKAATLFFGGGGAGKRFGLATNESFVLP